jgi:CBS domain-containing protein
MLTVKKLLAAKPHHQVFSVAPSQSVYEALEKLAQHNIGAVVVLEDGHLVGIFSERDYARKGIIQDRKAKTTPVSDVMTPKVITVTPDQGIEHCMQLMSEKHFRHLPVMEGDAVIGVLSVGDIVTAILREQKDRIQSLEQYIMAG